MLSKKENIHCVRAGHNKKTAVVLCMCILLFICIGFTISLWKYHSLRNSWAYDLASSNHYIWNLIRGSKYVTLTPSMGSCGPFILRRDHFSPIVLLFLPFYSLLPRVETLLFLQVFIIALGIVPAYHIVKSISGSASAGLMAGVFYILNPPILNLAVYQFEFLCLFVPFLIFTVFFYMKRDLLWFTLFACLSLSVREEAIFIVALMGFLPPLQKVEVRYRRIWFFYPLALAAAWFGLLSVYRHIFYGGSFIMLEFVFYLARQSLPDIFNRVSTLVSYYAGTWSLELLLALFSPIYLVPALSNFFILFFVSHELCSGPYYADLKYIAASATFIYIAFICTYSRILLRLKDRRIGKYLFLFLLSLFFISWWSHNLFLIMNHPSKFSSEDAAMILHMSEKIDQDAIVMTSYDLSPYFSSRRQLYCYEELEPFFSWDTVIRKADYVIIEKEDFDTLNQEDMAGMFKKIKETQNIILYERKIVKETAS